MWMGKPEDKHKHLTFKQYRKNTLVFKNCEAFNKSLPHALKCKISIQSVMKLSKF